MLDSAQGLEAVGSGDVSCLGLHSGCEHLCRYHGALDGESNLIRCNMLRQRSHHKIRTAKCGHYSGASETQVSHYTGMLVSYDDLLSDKHCSRPERYKPSFGVHPYPCLPYPYLYPSPYPCPNLCESPYLSRGPSAVPRSTRAPAGPAPASAGGSAETSVRPGGAPGPGSVRAGCVFMGSTTTPLYATPPRFLLN